MSRHDINRITLKVVNGEGAREKSSNERSLWIVDYKGKIYRVLFDDVHRCIDCIIPLEKLKFDDGDENPFRDLKDIRDALPAHKPARNRP